MTRALGLSILISTMIACGSGTPAPTTPAPTPVAPVAWPPTQVPAEATAALAPVVWILGDWTSAMPGESEHWVAARGALYGVHFVGSSWQVMIIDDGAGDADTADGVRRYLVLGDGHAEIEHREAQLERDHARFAAAAGTIDYQLRGDQLTVGDGAGDTLVERHFTRSSADANPPAPELEAADRAFAADTAAKGVDGWVTWFAPDGAMWRAAPIEGAAAIRETMSKTLGRGLLAWAPIASRVHDDVGFTVGTATFTANGATSPSWSGSYVTIWARQPDGSWKVRFDTGRGEHTPARQN